MIKTAKQLKDKIKNISGGDSNKAQTLIRNYMMERFLERITLSKYRNKRNNYYVEDLSWNDAMESIIEIASLLT